MKDMKLETKGGSQLNERDNYPSGLMINLGEEELKKLGFTGLPQVGDTMELVGKVRVIHAGEHDSSEGRMRNLGLQVTHLDFEEDEGDEKKDPAKVLYGEKNPPKESVKDDRGWGSYDRANGIR